MNSFFSLFKGKKRIEEDGFSDFFHRASKSEKEAVLLEVAKKASQDQRDLLKKYDEQLSQAK